MADTPAAAPSDPQTAADQTGGPSVPADAPMTVRFKEGCWDLHQSAEAGDLPKRLLTGELGRDEYAAFLGQMYLLARTLDDRIREHRDSVPALEALIDDAQFQAPYLEADLAHLGVTPGSIDPLPQTGEAIRLVTEASDSDPLMLLGLHYVREGANNGNRFIAKKLRVVLGLEDGGSAYLDPYGDAQPGRWAAFKRTLDEQDFTPEQRDRLVQAARAMFLAIMSVNDGVARTTG
jgi:heme oxygenase